MSSVQKITTPDSIRRAAWETVQSVLLAFGEGQDVGHQIVQALQLLESLPLSTSEFGLAVSRLRNAHRYLASDERGAAHYELRLLAGSLRDCSAKQFRTRPTTRIPRLRLRNPP